MSASAFGAFNSIAPGSWIEIYGNDLSFSNRSWTTADFQLLWRPTTIKALEKTSLALNVLNIADSWPPFYEAPQGIGYAPANANPLGRVVSFQLIKRW